MIVPNGARASLPARAFDHENDTCPRREAATKIKAVLPNRRMEASIREKISGTKPRARIIKPFA